MFLLNAVSSRVKNRYRNSSITTESASTIPAATRHDLVQQIESTLYPYTPSPTPSPSNRRHKTIESASAASGPAGPTASGPAAVHSKGGSSSSGSADSTGSTSSVGNAGNSTSSYTSNNSYNYNPNSSSHSHGHSHSHSHSSPRMTSSRKWRRKKRAEKENERLIGNLNQTIEETKGRLEAMNDKETFIDIRVRKYRTLLDEQSIRLCSQHLMHGNHYIRIKKSHTPDTEEEGGGGGDVESMNTSIHTTDLDIGMGGVDVASATDIQSNHTDEEYIIDVEKEAQIKKQFQIQEENEQKLQSVLDVQRKILTEMEICRRKLIDLQKKRDELVSKREECEDFIIASAQVDVLEQQNGKAGVSANVNVNANVNVANHHGHGQQGHVNYNDEYAANEDSATTMEMVTLTLKQVDDDELSSSPIQVI